MGCARWAPVLSPPHAERVRSLCARKFIRHSPWRKYLNGFRAIESLFNSFFLSITMPRHAPIEEFEDINRGLAYVRSLRTTWPGSISASGMGNVYRLLGLPLVSRSGSLYSPISDLSRAFFCLQERHLEEWPDDLELLTRPRYIASIARDHGHFYYSPRLWWMVDRRTPCRWTLVRLSFSHLFYRPPLILFLLSGSRKILPCPSCSLSMIIHVLR